MQQCQSSRRAKESLSNEIGNCYDVKVQSLSNPTLKIVGVDSDLTLAAIIDDINERNFCDFESVCVGFHIYTSRVSGLKSILIQVPPELYS